MLTPSRSIARVPREAKAGFCHRRRIATLRAMRLGRGPRTIHGKIVPAPRFTGWALLYFVLYIALPVLAVGLVLDLILFFVFDRFFDSCYAILCLF